MRVITICNARAAQTFSKPFVQPLQRGAAPKDTGRPVPGSNSGVLANLRGGQTEGGVRHFVLHPAHIAACAFDENDLVANDAIFFVQSIRKCGLFVEGICDLKQVFFT